VADAAHERAFRMPGEDLLDVRPIELRMADTRTRQAEFPVDFFDPARLAQRIGAIPFGFDVEGLDDAVARTVAAIIGGQVIAPDRRIIAIAERNGDRIAQPGVIIPVEIPEMLVRVNDGKFVSPGGWIRKAHRIVNGRCITPPLAKGASRRAPPAFRTP